MFESDSFRRLVRAVISVESAFNPQAESPVGACGLMQLMPATGREWWAKLKIKEPYDPFDTEQNVKIGSAYLAHLLNMFETTELALAAYNWGMGNVKKLLEKYPGQTWDYYQLHVPEETANYVTRVLERHASGYGNQRRNQINGIEAMLDKFDEVNLWGKKNMIEKIKQWILGSVGKSVIRKLMTLLAGVLVGIGLDPTLVNQWTDGTTQILIAVLLYLIAQGWSLVEKRIAQKQILP